VFYLYPLVAILGAAFGFAIAAFLTSRAIDDAYKAGYDKGVKDEARRWFLEGATWIDDES